MALAPIPSAVALAAIVLGLLYVWRHSDPTELCRWCGRPATGPERVTHAHIVTDTDGRATHAMTWVYCSGRCAQISITQTQGDTQP